MHTMSIVLMWVSESKNLIARMLTTNPADRASLHEIMNHPWMTKGFNSPPDNYLPIRKPLQLPLDPTVIDRMTGFNFGSPESITAEITRVSLILFVYGQCVFFSLH